MRSISLFASCVFLLASASLAAQQPVADGFPAPDLKAAASTAAVTLTGTVKIKVNIKLASTVPTGAVVRCGAISGLLMKETTTDPGIILSLSSATSSESVDAVVNFGSAVCNFSIPYGWAVPASTSSTTYTAEGVFATIGVSISQIDPTTGATVRTWHSTAVTVSTSTVPADKATTSLMASTVL